MKGRCISASTAVLPFLLPLGAQADLNNVPGMTEPQSAAAAAIQTVCPVLVANQSSLTPVQLDLQQTCTAMVQTSNQQQGSGGTTFSLGITEAELRLALQGVAGEEAATQGTNSVEIAPRGTARAIGARLGALRQGASGISVSSLQLNDNGNSINLADLLPERGGGAGESGSALGGFLNANYHFGDKDETSREEGFDFKNFGLVGGIDYRFSAQFVAGGAVNVNYTDVDITTFPDGDAKTLSTGLTLYGSWYSRDAFYVDGHLNVTFNDYETRRNIFIPSNNPSIAAIDRTAKADTDGVQYSAGLGAGWNIQQDALTITPNISLSYLKLGIDPYQETGAAGLELKVDHQDLKSLQSSLGVQLAYAVSTEKGILQPNGHIAWVHEFDNDSRSITARYLHDPFDLSTFSVPTNDPDRNYYTLGAGLSGTFAHGLMSFVSIEGVAGLKQVTNIGVLAGVRMEW